MIPRFKKSRFEPKPIETDYWIDLNENEYGGVFKYYDNNAMVWKQTESITREKEPQFISSAAYKITTNDIDYWNAKVGIEDFDALKEEILDLGSKFEGVTIETLEYYTDLLRSDFDNLISNKADKSSTLGGYGIRDAYTKTQIDNKFAEWKVELPENISYFKNDVGYVTESNLEDKLPDHIVSDKDYIHTDNNFNDNYKSKLDSLTEDLKAIEYDDTSVRKLISENTERITSLQSTVEENIAVAVETMSEEIARKANADEVYTKKYLDEVFNQFVRKTHKTYGYVDERPTKDLTTADTGFIFYDYTVNEPLLWVADEWRLLRTNQSFEGFLLEDDIVRQVTDWEWKYLDDINYVHLVKYLGEYSTTMDLIIPNIYIDKFVLNTGQSMDWWAGKSVLLTLHTTLGYNSVKDKNNQPVGLYRPCVTEHGVKMLHRLYKNINPGYYVPGVDEDPNDDKQPEDILVNYIENILGTKVMTPREWDGVTESYAATFTATSDTFVVNSFDIAQGVKTIGAAAFLGIKAVTKNELEIPSGVDFIDDYAFFNSSITELKFPRNPIKLGVYAFAKCPITKLHFPKTMDFESMKSGYSIGCFRECTQTIDLILDEGVKAIPMYCFYKSKTNLKEFPDSLEYVGAYAFYNSLTNFKFDSNKIKELGVSAFAGCTFSSVQFREDVITLPPFLFGSTTHHTDIKQLILPPNLEKIYPYSLPYEMWNIAQPFVTPPGLKSIPANCFKYFAYGVNCPSYDTDHKPQFPLPGITLYLSEGLECIESNCLFGSCFESDLILPESLKYIGYAAFAKPYGFVNTKLRIPKNVCIIGGALSINGSLCTPSEVEKGLMDVYQPASKSGYYLNTFWDYLEDGGKVSEYSWETFYQFGSNTMKEFEVDSENKWFKAIDGVLFSKDGKRMIGYPCAKDLEKYEIPEGCVYIDGRVFTATGFFDDITITKPDGSTQTIRQEWSHGIGDWYHGDNQLKEVVLANTIVNYSPDEMKQLFPTAHSRGELNMLWAAHDYACRIEKFSVKDDHPLYRMEGDWLVSKDGTQLQVIPFGLKGTHRIPDCVTEIVPGAFQYTFKDFSEEELINENPLNSSYVTSSTSSQLWGLYLIIPPSVVKMSDVMLFELNAMNNSNYNQVILEEGNPAFLQDVTGFITRR